MNQKQIKQLETELWDSANTLRATSKLTAAEYKDPVLGLILLRYAQNRFEQARERVEKNLPPLAPGRTRKESPYVRLVVAFFDLDNWGRNG